MFVAKLNKPKIWLCCLASGKPFVYLLYFEFRTKLCAEEKIVFMGQLGILNVGSSQQGTLWKWEPGTLNLNIFHCTGWLQRSSHLSQMLNLLSLMLSLSFKSIGHRWRASRAIRTEQREPCEISFNEIAGKYCEGRRWTFVSSISIFALSWGVLASDWSQQADLPNKTCLIGPQETMACVNSPWGLWTADQHSSPFVI